jgi:hypothetical protein
VKALYGAILALSATTPAMLRQLALILFLSQPAIASDIIDLRDYPESTKLGQPIYGKSCRTSTKIKPKTIEVAKCDRATVTGTDDANSFLYFRFLDEFGTGYLYITDRFKDPNMAKIRVLAKIIDNRVVAASDKTKGWCVVNAAEIKIACLLESDKAMIMSAVEAYD